MKHTYNSIKYYSAVCNGTSDRSLVLSGYSDSSTNNTDRHDITEILLKVALNIISLTLTLSWIIWYRDFLYNK